MNSSVVVTGAARGIGRGIAERMVARGHRVVITDIDGDAARGHGRRDRRRRGAPPGRRRPGVAPRGRRGGRAPRRTPRVVQQRRRRRRRQRSRTSTEAQVRRLVDVNLLGTLWGMRAAIEAFGERRRRHRQHRVAVRARAGPRLQRVRRHEGRDRLGVHVGRRRDPAQRPGARAVPRRRPDRDARRPDPGLARRPGWSTPAAGSSPSTRSPRRPSTWSAATAWCCSIPRWRGALMRGTALAPSVAKRGHEAGRGAGEARHRDGARPTAQRRGRRDTHSNICSACCLICSNT